MCEELDTLLLELEPIKVKGKFQGKRAELGVYDDAWICGDNGVEFVVGSVNNATIPLQKAFEEFFEENEND